MENPPPGSFSPSPQYESSRQGYYMCSKVYPRHLYSRFKSLFHLPRVYALESAVQQPPPTPASLLPVSPADALTAAAEDLRRKVIENRNIITEVEIQEYLASETGMDRLKKMYTKDVDGLHSPELWFVGSTLLKICGMTFLITSYFGGKDGGEKFVKQNQATAYRTQFQASRLMTDHVVLSGMKTGFTWSYRTGVFSSIFLLVSQSIAVYRNKSSVMEYIIASGITGSCLKANLGLKGMVSGGVFGSIMGLIGGTIIYGSMLALNETQEQRHYWNIQKYLEVQKELQSGRD